MTLTSSVSQQTLGIEPITNGVHILEHIENGQASETMENRDKPGVQEANGENSGCLPKRRGRPPGAKNKKSRKSM